MQRTAGSSHPRRLVLTAAFSALLTSALLMPTVARPQTGNDGPKPPTGLRITSSSTETLTLSWIASRAGLAKGFRLYRDGKRVGSTARHDFAFTGLSCGSAYALSVEAFDAAGRRSESTSVIAASGACPAPTPPERRATPHASPTTGREGSRTAVTPPSEKQVDASGTESPHESLPVPEPRPIEVSWAGAGAFVWHENDVAPESLGQQLHENGFSWVAVLIHDGMDVDPIEADWVRRFRESSGLPVGGWGVLRTRPEQEAELADRLVEEYSLDFYVANPEAEYKYSGDDGQSGERYGRSQRFVDSFRQLQPNLPAAISSYCRADTQDIDWETWSLSGFVFMPQAYVNDLGDAASPASCVEGAADFFPTGAVHPTVGVYGGYEGEPSPAHYAELLDEAGTVGFSVYLAETRMRVEEWRAFGEAIVELAIARRTEDGVPHAAEVVPTAPMPSSRATSAWRSETQS